DGGVGSVRNIATGRTRERCRHRSHRMTSGSSESNVEEHLALLVRQKEESDERLAALQKARSRVAFFGGPQERAAHPRHPFFADCYDDWSLPKIEKELGREQRKNDALARNIEQARVHRQHEIQKPRHTKQSTAFSHSMDYRSVSLDERIFNLTARQAQIIEILH